VIDLVARLVELEECLAESAVPHAFGGALALAWCTQRARGTIDIDVNIFVPADDLDRVEAALPPGIEVTDRARREIASDGQTRLWWDQVPVDVFFNTTDLHEAAARRTLTEEFAGRRVPFLACSDLAVFKVFLDRPRDRVDLGEMFDAGSLDVERVVGTLAVYLGADDPRVARLLDLRRT
jgi:hypothetical protein